MQSAFKTDVGQLRAHNEDNGGIYTREDGAVLAVVADGMGGHQAGDVASEMTNRYLSAKWEDAETLETPASTEKWLLSTITDVNKHLFEHANNHSECQGMGTTIVTAVCTKQFVTIAHIGDSRGYLFNNNGFVQITTDHSLVNELVRTGQISDEEAENHPRKNVLLRALGTEEEIKVDVSTVSWEQGDYLLLCSDGLSNKVSDEEMKQVLVSEAATDVKVNQLVELANDRGGEDNITLALIHFSVEAAEDR
ncbi:Stp1/IreP family PP2C-type Ser/Thr phosphatase [Desertibacillus haloalkaliphilus]|uniref:Stp1/IreP family PP2C-type Ser/Thr phosphatase n=1 Tax=Desertibacillus haloalkaliphilus TaxID=1328930 RepID=UPI001C26AFB0|nr:Stp1/IreP family PP2C-type Ser/Thr phosphatase [Desertibacillus haloalkaliphilus]MBU8907060.1 Stp1/IreP family PP2C-type Ser/Thr phosphatase [Desertibacillus haloalkaliphilus]